MRGHELDRDVWRQLHDDRFAAVREHRCPGRTVPRVRPREPNQSGDGDRVRNPDQRRVRVPAADDPVGHEGDLTRVQQRVDLTWKHHLRHRRQRRRGDHAGGRCRHRDGNDPARIDAVEHLQHQRPGERAVQQRVAGRQRQLHLQRAERVGGYRDDQRSGRPVRRGRRGDHGESLPGDVRRPDPFGGVRVPDGDDPAAGRSPRSASPTAASTARGTSRAPSSSKPAPTRGSPGCCWWRRAWAAAACRRARNSVSSSTTRVLPSISRSTSPEPRSPSTCRRLRARTSWPSPRGSRSTSTTSSRSTATSASIRPPRRSRAAA